MPFTFEQAQQWVASNGAASIDFTMIRTQGDGRVGYLNGVFHLLNQNQVEMNARSGELFSDRVANIPVINSAYSQPFDNDPSHQNSDSTFLRFRKRGPSAYQLEVTFERWNQTPETLAMKIFPRTSVYTGVGPPVGQSNFFALYVLSFDAMSPAPPLP